MKTFVISIIIFCLTITLIAVNYGFIHRTIDDLAEMVKLLEAGEEWETDGGSLADDLTKLKEYWDDKKSLISLSINYNDINDITNLIASLISFYESGDISQYENARAVLRESVDSLRRLERISIDNIL